MTVTALEAKTRSLTPFQTLMESGNEGARCSLLELGDEVPSYSTQSAELHFWLPLSGRTDMYPRHGRPYSVDSSSRVGVFPAGAVWNGAWRGSQTCMMLVINQSVMREFTRSQHLFPRKRQLTLVEDERLRSSILALHQDMLSPSPASDLFFGHITRGITSHYLRTYSAAPLPEPPPARRLAPRDLQRVLELIEARLSSKPALDELAGMLGLTVTSFCRRFKNSTGLPPYQYLLHARVRRAKEALRRQPPASLSELALMLGFYDQSQFTNTFRRIVGVSPRQYLRGQA